MTSPDDVVAVPQRHDGPSSADDDPIVAVPVGSTWNPAPGDALTRRHADPDPDPELVEPDIVGDEPYAASDDAEIVDAEIIEDEVVDAEIVEDDAPGRYRSAEPYHPYSSGDSAYRSTPGLYRSGETIGAGSSGYEGTYTDWSKPDEFFFASSAGSFTSSLALPSEPEPIDPPGPVAYFGTRPDAPALPGAPLSTGAGPTYDLSETAFERTRSFDTPDRDEAPAVEVAEPDATRTEAPDTARTGIADPDATHRISAATIDEARRPTSPAPAAEAFPRAVPGDTAAVTEPRHRPTDLGSYLPTHRTPGGDIPAPRRPGSDDFGTSRESSGDPAPWTPRPSDQPTTWRPEEPGSSWRTDRSITSEPQPSVPSWDAPTSASWRPETEPAPWRPADRSPSAEQTQAEQFDDPTPLRRPATYGDQPYSYRPGQDQTPADLPRRSPGASGIAGRTPLGSTPPTAAPLSPAGPTMPPANTMPPATPTSPTAGPMPPVVPAPPTATPTPPANPALQPGTAPSQPASTDPAPAARRPADLSDHLRGGRPADLAQYSRARRTVELPGRTTPPAGESPATQQPEPPIPDPAGGRRPETLAEHKPGWRPATLADQIPPRGARRRPTGEGPDQREGTE